MYNVLIVDIQNVAKMAKFMIYVPVNGVLTKTIDAESEEEALEMYLDEQDALLNQGPFQLTSDLDTAYLVKLNDKIKC